MLPFYGVLLPLCGLFPPYPFPPLTPLLPFQPYILLSLPQDGSFYVWQVAGFALVRSFMLPHAPQLRQLQRCFALSSDGQLLVAAGVTLPMLLVFNCVRLGVEGCSLRAGCSRSRRDGQVVQVLF